MSATRAGEDFGGVSVALVSDPVRHRSARYTIQPRFLLLLLPLGLLARFEVTETVFDK